MKLKFIAAAFSLGFGLMGCNTVQTLTTAVTPSQVIVAANGFDALEATATTYLRLPPCGAQAPTVCRDASVVAQIVPAIRAGRAARNTLEAAIKSSSGAPVNTSVFTALTTAVTALQAIFTQNGIS